MKPRLSLKGRALQLLALLTQLLHQPLLLGRWRNAGARRPSTGPVVQELLIGSMYDRGGGALGPVFGLLFGSAACAMVFCAVLVVRNRRGGNGI